MSNELETGGSLTELQKYALKWFQDNNVEIPDGARKWSKCSVKAKQIPPGTTYQTLRRMNINLSDFISGILGITITGLTVIPNGKNADGAWASYGALIAAL